MNPECTVFNPLGWEVSSASIRGASHDRVQVPNQDAVYWYSSSGTGEENLVCVAVADGHGGTKYVRSAVGSKFAARITVDMLVHFVREVFSNPDNRSTSTSISRIAKETLPRKITNRWSDVVKAHYYGESFTEAELDPLAALEKEELVANHRVAYGSTVLGAAVTDNFILYVQLGDGDILTVDEDGEVTVPLVDDPRAFANQTPSLCSENAWQDFRVSFRATEDGLPALILLTTDGYRNSFRTREGFYQVGSDILTELLANGTSRFVKELPLYLAETTERGSGDDITIATIFRSELIGISEETKEEPSTPSEGIDAGVEEGVDSSESEYKEVLPVEIASANESSENDVNVKIAD